VQQFAICGTTIKTVRLPGSGKMVNGLRYDRALESVVFICGIW